MEQFLLQTSLTPTLWRSIAYVNQSIYQVPEQSRWFDVHHQDAIDSFKPDKKMPDVLKNKKCYYDERQAL